MSVDEDVLLILTDVLRCVEIQESTQESFVNADRVYEAIESTTQSTEAEMVNVEDAVKSTIPQNGIVVPIKFNNFRDVDDEYDSDYEDIPRGEMNSDEELEFIINFPTKVHKKVHAREYHNAPKSTRISRGSKVKNEYEYEKLDPVEVPRFILDANAKLLRVGCVVSIIDCLVSIQSEKHILLDFDSILFNNDRSIFGLVFDIIGNVQQPLFVVRFKSPEEAKTIEIGREIFCAKDQKDITKIVLLSQLMDMKITDDCDKDNGPDFSDDEAERRYEKQSTNRKRQRNTNNWHQMQNFHLPSAPPQFRGRGRGRGRGRYF